MNTGLHVKYPLFLFYFSETSIFLHIFKKYQSIKFQENPLSGSQDFPCRQLDRWADMTKLIVAFHNFVNTPKNCLHCLPWRVQVNDILSFGLVVKVLLNNYNSK